MDKILKYEMIGGFLPLFHLQCNLLGEFFRQILGLPSLLTQSQGVGITHFLQKFFKRKKQGS
jgi:hypothetical protein